MLRRCDHNVLWLLFALLQTLLIAVAESGWWATLHIFCLCTCTFTFLLGSWTTLGTYVNHGWHIRLYVLVKRTDTISFSFKPHVPTTAPRGPGK